MEPMDYTKDLLIYLIVVFIIIGIILTAKEWTVYKINNFKFN